MAIGLSTYAFQWRGSEAAAHPVDLFGMIDETIELGGTVLQICDYPAIETMSDDELVVVRDYATGSGVKLELGTRGIATAHLMRYLELALILDASFVRSMLHVPDLTPSATESIDLLRTAIPEFASNEVTLGLETYELVPTSELVDIVAAVDSRFLGICLDPANSVARLEMPSDTIN